MIAIHIIYCLSLLLIASLHVNANENKIWLDEEHERSSIIPHAPSNNSTRELQKALKCTDGIVGGYPCQDVNLLARMPLSSLGAFGPEENLEASDLWGWTDPDTGKEYAIIGLYQGTSFVDISSPLEPVVIAKLPATVEGSAARDIKTYGHYAYIVSETEGHGVQIFDLSLLKQITNPPVYVRPTAFYGFTVGINDFRSNVKSNDLEEEIINDEYDEYEHKGRNLRGFDDYYYYDDYYYSHDDDDGNLLQNTHPPWWGTGGDAHNIFINEESGFAYLVGTDKCNGGLYILSLSDPLRPSFVGCFGETGYIHDVQCVIYRGPDKAYKKREICFASNAKNGLSIIDVTNKAGPLLVSRIEKAYFKFISHGWLNQESNFFIMADEGRRGGSKTYVIDVSNLDKPTLNGIHTSVLGAQPHNFYVRGQYVYQANYRGGLRVLNILQIYGEKALAGYFDVYKQDDNYGYQGAFGVYPFFKSGNVIISSTDQGLFVVKPKWLKPANESEEPECRCFCFLQRIYRSATRAMVTRSILYGTEHSGNEED